MVLPTCDEELKRMSRKRTPHPREEPAPKNRANCPHSDRFYECDYFMSVAELGESTEPWPIIHNVFVNKLQKSMDMMIEWQKEEKGERVNMTSASTTRRAYDRAMSLATRMMGTPVKWREICQYMSRPTHLFSDANSYFDALVTSLSYGAVNPHRRGTDEGDDEEEEDDDYDREELLGCIRSATKDRKRVSDGPLEVNTSEEYTAKRTKSSDSDGNDDDDDERRPFNVEEDDDTDDPYEVEKVGEPANEDGRNDQEQDEGEEGGESDVTEEGSSSGRGSGPEDEDADAEIIFIALENQRNDGSEGISMDEDDFVVHIPEEEYDCFSVYEFDYDSDDNGGELFYYLN